MFKWTEPKINKLRAMSKTMTMSQAADRMEIKKHQVDHASRRYGISFKKIGQHHHSSVRSSDDVELIRALRDEGLGVEEIADKFEIHSGTVSKYVNFVERPYG